MTAVLPFQFEGWEYQPPAGDQTCLGYLSWALKGELFEATREPLTHGILPPPPYEAVSYCTINSSNPITHTILFNCSVLRILVIRGSFDVDLTGRDPLLQSLFSVTCAAAREHLGIFF